MTSCYVVAEAGLNHNGSRARLLDMVRAAAAAGCHGFKIQAYTASEFVGPDERFTYRQRDHAGVLVEVTERQVEMFERCALSFDDVAAAHAECARLNLTFIATATDPEWIHRVMELGRHVYLKIGSDDIVHAPLLWAAARSGLRVILSTGMASDSEIAAAIEVTKPLFLLHCVSLYPTPYDAANLRRMFSLTKYNVTVGYSDHTEGTMVGMMAAAMGAGMIEKHFTLDNRLPGPDHWFSADPGDLASLCRRVQIAGSVRGTGDIEPGPAELAMRQVARRSVVAARDLHAGVVLKPDMVAYHRPGTGMPPGREMALLGRVTARPFRAGELIDPDGFFSSHEVVH